MVRRLISGFTLDLSLNHGDNAKVENPLKKARKYIRKQNVYFINL